MGTLNFIKSNFRRLRYLSIYHSEQREKMTLFKLPFGMCFICLLLLMSNSMEDEKYHDCENFEMKDIAEIKPSDDNRPWYKKCFDCFKKKTETVITKSELECPKKRETIMTKCELEWFNEKPETDRQVLLEAITVSFKVYKNCNSVEMKNEMEKPAYGLNPKQTKELCKYNQVLKNSLPSKPSNDDAKLLPGDIRSFIGNYVQSNKNVLNLALANKNIVILKALEARKLDQIDPLRHFIKIVCPTLLTYLDDPSTEFSPRKAGELFQAVKEIFTPEQVVDHENIEAILQEHASDLYDYIKNQTVYDPKKHYALYDKYVIKIGQNGVWAHFGFDVQHTEGLPLGTYYAEKDCNSLPSKSAGFQRPMRECVEKCQKDSNCNACTIGSSFHDFRMVMKPHKCYDKLGPRATYSGMALWIKNDPKELPLKAKENTKQHWLARRNREFSELISDLVMKKDGRAPKILLQTISDTVLARAKEFKNSHPKEKFSLFD